LVASFRVFRRVADLRWPASCAGKMKKGCSGQLQARLLHENRGVSTAPRTWTKMEVLREDLVRCRYSVVAPGGFAPAAFSGVAACALQRWFAVTVDLFWLTGALTMVLRWPWLRARCCCAVADGAGSCRCCCALQVLAVVGGTRGSCRRGWRADGD